MNFKFSINQKMSIAVVTIVWNIHTMYSYRQFYEYHNDLVDNINTKQN